MQTDTRFDWDAATERERDREIAVRVMGWTRHRSDTAFGVSDKEAATSEYIDYAWDYVPSGGDGDPQFRRPLPHYTTDPAADYEVLRHVREKWDDDHRLRFTTALCDLWDVRAPESRQDQCHVTADFYEPGDYSRAALSVMEEQDAR